MGDPDKPIGPDPTIPSLAVAMNAHLEDPPTLEIDRIDGDSVRTVLMIMRMRLTCGLGAAWETAEGKGNLSDTNTLDEQWARQISEMLLFTPYMGPNNYGFLNTQEGVFYRKMVDTQAPAYSILACCQQLATMGAITRGFPELAESPIGATSAANMNKVKGQSGEPGRIITKDDLGAGASAGSVRGAYENKYKDTNTLTPGSCYVHDTQPDHVAFVLRTRREKDSIQLFDTSGMGPPFPETPYPKAQARLGGGGGNYDYGWQGEMDQARHPIKHWGLLPQPPDTGLQGAIDQARTMRPLGFARVVLRERNPTTTIKTRRQVQRLVFATPLLLMYQPAEKMNFSIARFLWSLRYLPGRDRLEALVFIYIPTRIAHKNSSENDATALVLRLMDPPRVELGEDRVRAGREATLRDMVTKVGELRGSTDFQPRYGRDYFCVTVLSTVPDIQPKTTQTEKWGKVVTWDFSGGSFDQGNVIIRHRYGNVYDKATKQTTQKWVPDEPAGSLMKDLPWDRPSRGAHIPWDGFEWGNLEYFRGDANDGDWNVVAEPE